jgi:CRISPR-associated protein (TIGR02584 family)
MSPTAFSSSRRLLIAVMGSSPAVLTETVWALAQQNPPWIPDHVIGITTLTGRAEARRQLFDQGGWEQLCAALAKESLSVEGKLAFGASDSIRVLGDGRRDFDDIRTPEEGDAAADFILGVLRQYTEQPGTEIVASIAGGRKTMSALMLACMSLLGREQDRVCHVLAADPFIAKHPEFLFPHNRREQNAADIRLCDIPFVRVRGWYEKEYSGVPPSYMTLVKRFEQIAPNPASYPGIRIDLRTGICCVGENAVRLSPPEFSLLLVMAQWIKADHPPQSWYDLEQDLKDLKTRADIPASADWFCRFKEYKGDSADDFRKWASSARTKLRRAFEQPSLAEALLPSMRRRTDDLYPANKITILSNVRNPTKEVEE